MNANFGATTAAGDSQNSDGITVSGLLTTDFLAVMISDTTYPAGYGAPCAQRMTTNGSMQVRVTNASNSAIGPGAYNFRVAKIPL